MKTWLHRHKLLTIIILAAAVLATAAAVVFCNLIVVTLDSDGGTQLDSVYVWRGHSAGELPEPGKSGYEFIGWFYEDNSVPYSAADTLDGSTTVRAVYAQKIAQDNTAVYLGELESDAEFTVSSTYALTDDNIGDFIVLQDFGGSGVTLSVRERNGLYIISAADGFHPGFTYKLTIVATDAVQFCAVNGEDVSAEAPVAYSFDVPRAETVNITPYGDIVYVDAMTLLDISQVGTASGTGDEIDDGKALYGAYFQSFDAALSAGSIINLGTQGPADANSQYFKIISIRTDVSYQNASATYVELVTPNLGEVYETFDLYVDEPVDLSSLAANEQDIISQMSAQLGDPDGGYAQLLDTVVRAVQQTPSVTDAISQLPADMQNEFYAQDGNSVFNLAFSPSFYLSASDRGVDANLSCDSGSIKWQTGNVEITLRVKITESVKVSAFSQIISFFRLDEYENTGVYVTNTFGISITGSVAFSGLNDDDDDDTDAIDISDDLEELIENAASPADAFVQDLNNSELLEGNLDYEDIYTVNLGSLEVSIYEILNIKCDLSAFVSLGAQAGMGVQLQQSITFKIGSTNGTLQYSGNTPVGVSLNKNNEMRPYRDYVCSSFYYNVTLKGMVGIRGGLRVSVSISIFHLHDSYSIGISAEVGCYCEISGYVSVSGYSWQSTSARGSDIDVTGAFTLELGVYVSVDFNWKFWPFEGSHNLACWKFPLLSISTDTFFAGFAHSGEDVTVNTNEYNVLSDYNLALATVNLRGPGGMAIITEQTAERDMYAVSLLRSDVENSLKLNEALKYIRVNNGVITLSDDAPARLDIIVRVYYLGGVGQLSNVSDSGFIYKDFKLTFAKFDGDTSRQYTVNFHDPDDNIIESKTYYVGQRISSPDYYYCTIVALNAYCSLVDKDNLWLDADGQPVDVATLDIMQDTDLYLNASRSTFDVEFYYDYLINGDIINGAVQGESIAQNFGSFTVEVGTPESEFPFPDASEFDLPDFIEFIGWEPVPYRQNVYRNFDGSTYYQCHTCYAAVLRDTRCRISFYGYNATQTLRLSVGETPQPDMTLFENDNYKFSYWSPEIVPVNGDANYYMVMTRSYSTVTFYSYEGDTVDVQTVRRGTLPTPPEVPEIIETGVPYYVLKFSHWTPFIAAADGSNQSYRAIYKGEYVEVSETFDSQGRQLADGAVSVYTGSYDPRTGSANETFKVPSVDQWSDDDYIYTLSSWRSTTTYDGYYITLYPGHWHNFVHGLTYRPVYEKTDNKYAVTFTNDYGVTLTLHGSAGESITAAMLESSFARQPSAAETYAVSDYGLSLPYTYGSSLDAAGNALRSVSAHVSYTSAPRSYTATFNANGGAYQGGSATASVTNVYGTQYQYNATEPTRAGYTFAGWASTANSAAGSAQPLTFTLNSNLTWYAVWQPNTINVTFSANGAAFSDSQTIKTSSGPCGSSIGFSEVPINSDTTLVFSGWSESSSSLTGSTAASLVYPSADCDYYAVWRQANTVALTFNAGSGAWLFDGWSSYNYSSGSLQVSVASGAVLNLPGGVSSFVVRPGTETTTYTLSGWSPTFCFGSSTFTSDTQLSASYTSSTKVYTVEFDSGSFLVRDTAAGTLTQPQSGSVTYYNSQGQVVSSLSSSGGFADRVNMDIASASVVVNGVTYTTDVFWHIPSVQLSQSNQNAAVSAYFSSGWSFTAQSGYSNTYFAYANGTLPYGLRSLEMYDAAAGEIRFYTDNGGFTYTDESNSNLVASFIPVFNDIP